MKSFNLNLFNYCKVSWNSQMTDRKMGLKKLRKDQNIKTHVLNKCILLEKISFNSYKTFEREYNKADESLWLF